MLPPRSQRSGESFPPDSSRGPPDTSWGALAPGGAIYSSERDLTVYSALSLAPFRMIPGDVYV